MRAAPLHASPSFGPRCPPGFQPKLLQEVLAGTPAQTIQSVVLHPTRNSAAKLRHYMARTHSAPVPNICTPSHQPHPRVSSKPQRHPLALSSPKSCQVLPSDKVSPTCEDSASSLYTKLLPQGLCTCCLLRWVILRACLSKCHLIRHLSTRL